MFRYASRLDHGDGRRDLHGNGHSGQDDGQRFQARTDDRRRAGCGEGGDGVNGEPQTAAERHTQLCRIADALLIAIERGRCSTVERGQLIRSYETIDRILQRHESGSADDSEFNSNILSLADLINNPMPNRELSDVIDDGDVTGE